MLRLSVLLTILLLASCSKEFVIQESSSLDNFTCPSIDNCLSSKEKLKSKNYIMPFKMLADTGPQNIDLIEKVLLKIGGHEIEKTDSYLKATNEELQIEFIADPSQKVVAVRSQVKKQGFFSYNQGRSEVEKVRFNLFQGDF